VGFAPWAGLSMVSRSGRQLPVYGRSGFDWQYEVPADLRSKLFIPHLSERAKSLIGRLEAKSLDNYEEVKRFLLGEFKFTEQKTGPLDVA